MCSDEETRKEEERKERKRKRKERKLLEAGEGTYTVVDSEGALYLHLDYQFCSCDLG